MATLTPYEVSLVLRDCAFEALDPTIQRKCVVPGEISWDVCDCGQLTVSENRRYIASAFPTEAVDFVQDCGNPWLVVDYTVSVLRCVPVGGEGRVTPTCASLEAAAMQLSKDKDDVRRALFCCLEELYDAGVSGINAFQVLAQETTGPQGGCAGSDTQVLVGFLNPCGC